MSSQQPPVVFKVQLPAGGELTLHTQEEVDMWESASKAYRQDYRLAKQNDLVLLGAILTQQLALFRSQQEVNGMEPEFDNSGIPTGRYKKIDGQKSSEKSAAQKRIAEASKEIREIEKALGIDKKTREAGGAFNVADYIRTVKEAGHAFGIHISKRQKAYEEIAMEARWRIRLLRNGDAEDKQHHGISEAKIIDWMEEELAKLEEIDKKFANEVGKVYVGKL